MAVRRPRFSDDLHIYLGEIPRKPDDRNTVTEAAKLWSIPSVLFRLHGPRRFTLSYVDVPHSRMGWVGHQRTLLLCYIGIVFVIIIVIIMTMQINLL